MFHINNICCYNEHQIYEECFQSSVNAEIAELLITVHKIAK